MNGGVNKILISLVRL